MGVLAVLVGLVALQASPLDTLEAKLRSALAETNVEVRQSALEEVADATIEMIDRDALREPAEFRRASKLLDLSGMNFERCQVRYEAALAALSGGDQEARVLVGPAWDALLVAMSRGRRLGIDRVPGKPGNERYAVRPTAKAIIAVYRDPKRASADAGRSPDNTRIKAIVDADQKARTASFANMGQKDFERLVRDDAARLKETKAIVASGGLKTANDFDSAALVCQHGVTFEDYALAHELSVCAILLGKRSASWLAGASYDRMRSNCGYGQRFATQYTIVGGVTRLSKVDPSGINDTMRRLVVRRTLDEARNVKFD